MPLGRVLRVNQISYIWCDVPRATHSRSRKTQVNNDQCYDERISLVFSQHERQWQTPNSVRVLTAPDADRTELARRARSKGGPARVVERARIVLLAADKLTGPQIAEPASCIEPTVVKWRRQCAEAGLARAGGSAAAGRPEDGTDR